MIPDRLFDLAFQYRKSNLWKKLWDSQLFGVRLSDGEIGYCCVMGRMGELNAVAVYIGQKGLDSLRALQDSDPLLDTLDESELRHRQDCVMLSFNNKSMLNPRDLDALTPYCRKHGLTPRGKNAYPQFERFRTGYERWYLEDETDQRRMTEALEGVIEVASRLTREMKTPEQLGFLEGGFYDREIPLLTKQGDGFQWERHALPPKTPETWPSIVIEDELTQRRLDKAARKGIWAFKLFRHIEPMTHQTGKDQIAFDELEEAPFYPWVMMIVDTRSSMVLGVFLSNDADDYAHPFADQLAEMLTRAGVPRKIIVLDARTKAALEWLCERFKIELQLKEKCAQLEDALDSMVDTFLGDHGEDLLDQLEAMTEMFRDPEVIASLPDEVFLALISSNDPRAFPKELQDVLYREGVRRGLFNR